MRRDDESGSLLHRTHFPTSTRVKGSLGSVLRPESSVHRGGIPTPGTQNNVTTVGNPMVNRSPARRTPTFNASWIARTPPAFGLDSMKGRPARAAH